MNVVAVYIRLLYSCLMERNRVQFHASLLRYICILHPLLVCGTMSLRQINRFAGEKIENKLLQ